MGSTQLALMCVTGRNLQLDRLVQLINLSPSILSESYTVTNHMSVPVANFAHRTHFCTTGGSGWTPLFSIHSVSHVGWTPSFSIHSVTHVVKFTLGTHIWVDPIVLHTIRHAHCVDPVILHTFCHARCKVRTRTHIWVDPIVLHTIRHAHWVDPIILQSTT